MSIANMVVIGVLVVADLLLVWELRQSRAEIRRIRSDVPKWIGVSVAFTMLAAAVKLKKGD